VTANMSENFMCDIENFTSRTWHIKIRKYVQNIVEHFVFHNGWTPSQQDVCSR